MYSNVAKKEGPPPTPSKKPQSSQRKPHAVKPQRQDAVIKEDGEEEEAPVVPPKDPELVKECATQNGTPENDPPIPRERPTPKKRTTIKPKVVLPPAEEVERHVEPIESPGIDNPFYDGIIPINNPSTRNKPLPPIPVKDEKNKENKSKPKGRTGKSKRKPRNTGKAKEQNGNQPAKIEEPIAGVPVYELATVVPDLDEKVRVSEAHSSSDELIPTYITKAEVKDSGEVHMASPDSRGAKPKGATHEEANPVGSIIVDMYFYNFICTFKSNELESIQKKGSIRTQAAKGGTPREIEVRFKAKNPADARELEESFIQVYQRMLKVLWVESVNIAEVRDISELQNELQNKYESLCFHVSDKQLDVVIEKKNQSVITRCIMKHGGLGFAPQPHSNETETVSVQDESARNENAATPFLSDENPNVVKISYPVGYDVGGMFHVYIYDADITTLSVDAIVNAANGQLHHGGGVAKAISSAAGPALEKASREVVKSQKDIPVTKVVQTTAGNMPSKMVLHAVGPKWPSSNKKGHEEACLRNLKQTFVNVLDHANKEGVKTLAIPPISSGIFRVPSDKVANAIFEALIETADPGNNTKIKLREVHIVDIVDTVLNLLVAKFGSGGRFKTTSGKAIAVTEIAREDIKLSSKDKKYMKMIDQGPDGGTKLKRRKSFFGSLCGRGKRRNKYN